MIEIAKVHKVEFYVTDHEEEYSDKKHLEISIEQALYSLWVGVDHIKVESSESFEWDDDLIINNINATEEDFEKYLK